MKRPNSKIILKGIPASPGKAHGRVKIVNCSQDLAKLGRGNIIVTSFLSPVFLASIKKDLGVLGIITDMGGMTCHAAIAAREMRIPYIAGAICATKKLKNNVLISMDSESGVIYGKA